MDCQLLDGDSLETSSWEELLVILWDTRKYFLKLLWTALCPFPPPHPPIHIEALTTNVTICGDRDYLRK